LKREVRYAGVGLLVFCPLFGMLWSTRVGEPSQLSPAAVLLDAPIEEPVDPPGRWVTLSLRPESKERPFEARSLRVRPAGYLLPDDGLEESAHVDPRD
jgi:hypothetical protein